MSKETNEGTRNHSVTIPTFKEWSISKYYDFSAISADFTDLEELNRQIAAARSALFRLAESINKAERKAKEAKANYDRTYNRKYISSSEKTDSARKISAEIQVEDLENKYMYYEQLRIELVRAHQALRNELDALDSTGHNYRQQIRIA